MNMTDVLNFLRIINAISAFTITVFSLKKSNENPVFKPIAYLAAMLGFWNLIRFFLLQTKELPLSFIMMRSIYTCIAFSALFLFYYAQAYCIPNFKLLYRHLMTVIPVITCILSITAGRHSFFITINPALTAFDIEAKPFIYGPWFYVHALYSYALICLSCMLFFIKLFSPRVKNRKAVLAITVSIFIFMLMNVIGTFVAITEKLLFLSLFSHFISVNSLYFLTYWDMDQRGLYLGKKDFFQDFDQPVLIFNIKNELLGLNDSAVKFFTESQIPVKQYTLRGDMFGKQFFAPIQPREQNTSASYLQHLATGKVFLCHNKTIFNPKNHKSTGTIIIMYDAGMLGDLIQKIEQNAFTDGLCACLNRSCFELRKKTIVQHAAKPCLLLVADIDNLKKVNDTLGHKAGDDYIQTSVTILKKAIKTSNMLFRIGGDEFVAFIPQCTAFDAATIVRKIEKLCAKQTKPWPVSVSVGFSIITRNDTDLAHHFTQADNAMYAQKQQHKRLACIQAPGETGVPTAPHNSTPSDGGENP